MDKRPRTIQTRSNPSNAGTKHLVTAIAALGMKISFKDLAAVGWRPVALMVLETSWIAAVTIVAVMFT
jgi:uncharacterized membrane protein YadS